MITNPEPDDCVTFEDAQSPIVTTDPCRVDRLFLIDSFETEAGMVGIRLPHQVGLPGLLLNVSRQACIELPEFESGLGLHAGASPSSSVTFMSVA